LTKRTGGQATSPASSPSLAATRPHSLSRDPLSKLREADKIRERDRHIPRAQAIARLEHRKRNGLVAKPLLHVQIEQVLHHRSNRRQHHARRLGVSLRKLVLRDAGPDKRLTEQLAHRVRHLSHPPTQHPRDLQAFRPGLAQPD
jgi:hypothetical protein